MTIGGWVRSLGAVLVATFALLIAVPNAVASWSLQPAPSPVVSNGQLNSVSCRSATSCTAVGSYEPVAGTQLATAEQQKGAGWRIRPVPNPSGAITSSLQGVSCVAANLCEAVGYFAKTSAGNDIAMAEQWNGTDWTVQSVAIPSGAKVTSLAGISCTSATFCVAVGYDSGTTADNLIPEPMEEVWDGSTWRLGKKVENPYDTEPGEFAGVSCTTPTACTAAGWSTGNDGKTPMAARWNGTTWNATGGPSVDQTQQSQFTAISCVAATDCTVVGLSGTKAPYSARWSGDAWSAATPVPVPAGTAQTLLSSLMCSSATACTAAGYSSDTTQYAGNGLDPTALLETLDGTSWSAVAVPVPTGEQQSSLAGLACPSASACAAVGFSTPGVGGADAVLVDVWTGSDWVNQTAPSPPAAGQATLSGTSCPSVSSCAAVGYSLTRSGVEVPLAESWDGASWQIEKVPRSQSWKTGTLNAVSCNSDTACTAVGTVQTGSGRYAPLIERWNGTTWQIEAGPVPSGASSSDLSGVSCPATSACTAVGEWTSSSGVEEKLAENWNGTDWRIQTTPRPPGAYTAFEAVSCASVSTCTAVGVAATKAGLGLPFVEAWDGSNWTIESVPAPGNARFSSFTGISCPSASKCTAVGTADVKTTEVPLVEHWSGTSWTTQSTPATGMSNTQLSGVSCASTTDCTAVGVACGAGCANSLVEGWDGSTWTIQASPNASGSPINVLSSVSCAAPSTCLAAGYSETSAYLRDNSPLVEREAS
jgi:hypothetical protein